MSHFTTIAALEGLYDLEDLMEPYEEQTENPAYLEFVNVEQEYRDRYQNELQDIIILPGGKKCFPWDSEFSRKFILKDGSVYQKDFGPLHHAKRSKAAKKHRMIQIPLKKHYCSFEEFMNKFAGYDYIEEKQAFGFYHNPNAKWDWYVVGGRWPYPFLVRADVLIQIRPEPSSFGLPNPPAAPDGYRWVAGAQKMFIEWDLMKEIAVNMAVSEYNLLREHYINRTVPEEFFVSLTDEGIAGFNCMLFYKDESLSDYLKRYHLAPEDRYCPDTYAFLDQHGEWYAKGKMGWFGVSADDKLEDDWYALKLKLLDNVPDTHVLVSVDCHI